MYDFVIAVSNLITIGNNAKSDITIRQQPVAMFYSSLCPMY